jgi:hypothetical protein
VTIGFGRRRRRRKDLRVCLGRNAYIRSDIL